MDKKYADPVTKPKSYLDRPEPTMAELSRREYFAAMALQGILARGMGVGAAVSLSVTAADLLIEELADSTGHSETYE